MNTIVKEWLLLATFILIVAICTVSLAIAGSAFDTRYGKHPTECTCDRKGVK